MIRADEKLLGELSSATYTVTLGPGNPKATSIYLSTTPVGNLNNILTNFGIVGGTFSRTFGRYENVVTS